MTYRVCKVDGSDARIARKILALDLECFEEHNGNIIPSVGYWWLVYDGKGSAVAYAGMKQSAQNPANGYMNRVGVVEAHRGHGLQARLIDARVRFARRIGWKGLTTDTYDNPQSGNNLIRAGFMLYDPPYRWAFDNGLYWKKVLS